MTVEAWAGPGVVGLLAIAGAYMAVRVGQAEIRVWSKQHEKTDDERHSENLRRFQVIEDEMRDNSRRDMREAAAKIEAAVAILRSRDGG